MNFRQQMMKKWMTVLLTVVLLGMMFLGAFAEDLFQVGENYWIEAPEDIFLDYSVEYDLYYAIDSVTGSFIVLSPAEYDDFGFAEDTLTTILEDESFETDTTKFVGGSREGNGFRYRSVKRLEDGAWYDAIFAYYGTHLLRLTCIDGDPGVLTALIQNTYTTPTPTAADTGTETRVDIGADFRGDDEDLYNLALNAYLDEDYETAAKYAIPAAEQGDTNACYLLGLMYYYGNGVEQSYEKSAEYMKLAADAGDSYAQENMGIFYFNGQGVERSYEMAFWYFRLAADQGQASAQYNVGVMYYQGQGVDVDYEAAVDYWALAAEQGHGSAQNNLGWMYSHGYGVSRSYDKAVEYFRLAAEQDQSTPQTNLAWMYEHGLGVSQSSDLAADYYHMAAENLYEGCTVVIGAYEQNNDTADGKEPIEWLVLEFDGDRVLLGAKYGLDTLPYSDIPDAATWESSSLRTWLNGTFYEEAFSPTEKTGIQSASVPNPENSVFGTAGGNDTTDRIFLLSAEEIERFSFVNFESKATDTAKANGAYVLGNGNSFWWLRTPGITAMEASVVDENGAVSGLGLHITSTYVTVVPAMWVSLTEIQPAPQGGEQVAVTETAVPAEPAPAAEVPEESRELYEQGLTAYEAGNYTSALPYLKSAAEMGNPDAMLLMGNMYAFGYGVEKNGETAKDYYLGAAEQGNAEANFLLGEMYVAGFGVPKDQAMASYYYQQAADLGHADAQLKIASRYYNGTVIEQNYETAFHYYQLAADQGKEDAYNMLGILYENGRGTEQSYGNAIKYYRMAVDAGDEYGMHNLAYMYFYGKGVDQSYEEAFKYFQMAADLGKADDQYMTGLFYYYGYGTDQSYQMAFYYLSLAAVQKDSDAQNMLGNMYLQGDGIEQSDETAFEYYQKSADQGNYYGQASLAWMYYSGTYVERSDKKAFEYYKLAADGGMVSAQAQVGYMYLTGRGVEQSYKMAAKYSQMAADSGLSSAQNNMGYLYQHGLGVGQDYEKAFEYYTLAAEQENITAINNLGFLYEYGLGVEQSEETAIQYYQTVVENLSTGLDLGFGTFEQDLDFSNGPEPIEWFVVKIEGDRALMMARYGLDAQAFCSGSPNSDWDGSFMQSWLNNDFYNAAFTDLQKSRILSSGESGDRIFLLSLEQASEIIENQILFMETEGTAFAVSKGANFDIETGCSWYWLMTPGTIPGSVAYIDEHGQINEDGMSADISEGLVVPAFWLDLTALNH